jgi:hypothetical protein
MPLRKNILNMPKGLPNPGFIQESTKRGFSEKAIARIDFFFVVLGFYESLEGLEC